MASTPPWNTTSEHDPLRFTTTSMAAAAFTPSKPRRRVPWGVDELRPSTSPAKPPPPAFRRSPSATRPARSQRHHPEMPGKDSTRGRRRGGPYQAWKKSVENAQSSSSSSLTRNSKARTATTTTTQSSNANATSKALVVASPAAQQRPQASRSMFRPGGVATTLSASPPVATNLRVTTTTKMKTPSNQQQEEVARRTGLSAHSIHASTVPEGQARPRRYFSNYLDAAQGHTYKVSEVDHHVLTNRNLEASPPAPVPLVFRQFQQDPSQKRYARCLLCFCLMSEQCGE